MQKHHERLTRGRRGSGSRSNEDACDSRRNQRRGKPQTPPVSAGGGRVVASPAGHPVNWDGPWRGRSSAAAQAR